MTRLLQRIVFLSAALSLVACAQPHTLPSGPTPIPTLIPATAPGNALGATESPAYTIQSYPARLPSATMGQSLFATHCASCHGEDGAGVVPGARNFNDLDYMRGETPAAFYAAITEGRGDMPSFRDTLTSDERWDLVAFIWRFSTSVEALGLGEQTFDANCAACHGADGTGVVLGAADFTDLRLMDSKAPRDLYLAVTQGVGSMPAWQSRLSQDERWAVIDYLRTFSYDPTLTGEVAMAAPPSPTSSSISCDAYLGQVNPYDWADAGALVAGQDIYEQSCAICHGPDGSGALPSAPDLTASDFQGKLRSGSGEILCVIAEGENAMPAWKETLSSDEMWQVLTYIGSLRK